MIMRSYRASWHWVLALGLLTASAQAAGEGWIDNYESAKATAAKEKKDILLDFTGSDWCGWCIKLDKEVFSQDAFKTEAPKHFVLVTLDFPRDKSKISAETSKQNTDLSVKYGIQGYPTLILTDATGAPYAQTGYREGGPDAYIAHLTELRAKRVTRDEAFAKAAQAAGLDKAKMLDQAISAIGPELALLNYGDKIDEIIALDADNQAGLKSKYQIARRMTEADQFAAEGNFAGAVEAMSKVIDEFKPTGQQAQDLYFQRSLYLYRQDKKDEAKADLEKALEMAPQGEKAEQIKSVIKRVFSAPEAGPAAAN